MSRKYEQYRQRNALGVATHYAHSFEYRPGFEYLGRGAREGLTFLPPLLQWVASSGLLELMMTLEQAQSCSGRGQQDDNVRTLSEDRSIAEQLAKLDPVKVSEELKGYGAWDEAELADHAQNLQRLVWLAACDLSGEEANGHAYKCPRRVDPGNPCTCGRGPM